ncbi:hypothetical protein EMIHUDRAFT_245479 [Emiliania huxleyi CCMP1516]|uniref:Uncharacterized protein n=2 Tax=Emiliania huxleyi TaxID=2903 RepID=A0A0D3IX90_EMIH1|nr:hypothetical protein EMIHUDRAFT_245479 [Emiliania huxleyi CCMP1516]EOD15875.1 hypothetical protein EMIHUDRAFT_245479 [Emiliania huxleyi CCMP1516]|eukprot:XP_005768304.1 hypothetical protein EMIHUDRAFT_245479 [Emiliania huxleyi CCMP1516]
MLTEGTGPMTVIAHQAFLLWSHCLCKTLHTYTLDAIGLARVGTLSFSHPSFGVYVFYLFKSHGA